jgi:hypothetical protein
MSDDTRPDLQMPLDDLQVPHSARFDVGGDFAEALRPVNWNLLTADEASAEWHDLDTWVNWLRNTYGLPPTILPPFWHRHDELIWELSALHLHWRASYDSEAPPSAPCAWHRDFAEARSRLREWVSLCGTRLDRDRPTRRTAWPGEPPTTAQPEREIANRDEDFELFVLEDIAARPRLQHRVG